MHPGQVSPIETRVRWPFLVALAAAIPLALALLLHFEIRNELEPRLSELVHAPVTLGWVDVTPGAGFRLSDVRIGSVLELDSAIVYPDLFGPDRRRIREVRLDKPRWRLRPHAQRAADPDPAPARPRSWQRWAPARLVVDDAELVVDLEDSGELIAREIAITPVPGGIRVISPDVVARMSAGSYRFAGTFGRFAADLSWPQLQVQRAIAARGSLTVLASHGPVTIEQAIVSHSTAAGHMTHISGTLGRGSVRADVTYPHRLSIEVDAVPLSVFGGVLPEWVSASFANASGRVAVELDKQTINASGHISDLLLSHRVLASEPVPLALGVELDGAWMTSPDALTFLLANLRLQFRGVQARFAGRIGWRPSRGDFDTLDLRLELSKVDCARLLLAVPEPFKRHLAGMEVVGRISGSLHLLYDRENPEATRLDVDLPPYACQVLAEPLEADARCAKPLEQRPDGCWELSPHTAAYIPLAQLKPAVTRAFVLAEDGNFFNHRGFDIEQIAHSFSENLGARRLVRGGSTISQQVTKNLFLSHERTLARKLEEVVLTWRLEHYLTKDEILEQYLNLVQLSDSAFGIQAGARQWFGKPASELRPAEAAFLAALLPAPAAYAQRLRADGRIDVALRARIDAILHRLLQNGSLDQAAYRDAIADEIAFHTAR